MLLNSRELRNLKTWFAEQVSSNEDIETELENVEDALLELIKKLENKNK